MESRCDHKSERPSLPAPTHRGGYSDRLRLLLQPQNHISTGSPPVGSFSHKNQIFRAVSAFSSSSRLHSFRFPPSRITAYTWSTSPGPGPESYLNILPALRLFRDAVLSRSIAEKCRLQHFEWPPCWSDAASLAISGLHFLYLFSLISHKCYYTGLYPHLHVFSESSLRRSSKTVFAD